MSGGKIHQITVVLFIIQVIESKEIIVMGKVLSYMISAFGRQLQVGVFCTSH
jgi:hypothetical protein